MLLSERVCVCVSVWDLTWKWLVKSHKQEALKCQEKNTHTLSQTHTGYGDVVFISIFECIPAPTCTNTQPLAHMHSSCSVCSGAGRSTPECVCARLPWSGRSSPSWLACLFFIKMPLNSSTKESGAAGGIFSIFPFLFSPFQATLVASSQVFSSIFSFLHSFVRFLVNILAVCPLTCFFFFYFAWFWKNSPASLSSKAGRFTFHQPQNTWIIFIHDQTGLWMTLLGALGANCAFEFSAMIDGEKQSCVFCNGCSWTIFKFR